MAEAQHFSDWLIHSMLRPFYVEKLSNITKRRKEKETRREWVCRVDCEFYLCSGQCRSQSSTAITYVAIEYFLCSIHRAHSERDKKKKKRETKDPRKSNQNYYYGWFTVAIEFIAVENSPSAGQLHFIAHHQTLIVIVVWLNDKSIKKCKCNDAAVLKQSICN